MRLGLLGVTAYAGGCFFGLIMLAFTFMGTGNMYLTAGTIDEKKYKYDNFKEYMSMVKQVKIYI
jgi:hypothetical protein